MKKILIVFALLFIASCAQAKDFDYGAEQINNINSKYNTTMETYPKTVQRIDSMLSDFEEIKGMQLATGQEPFDYLLSFRIRNLEAERLLAESQKYGSAGTTKYGFGCKIRPLIIESAALRSSAAIKGFETVDALMKFIDNHPKEAHSVGLSPKNALFLNATFYQISEDAERDSRVINNFCPITRVLELYQEEFKKKTNLSDDFINNLDYEQAAEIWKERRGFS